MPPSTLVGRSFAVLACASAVGVFLVAVAALPPVAERWILADGAVGTTRARTLLYGAALVGFVVAGLLLAGSIALWRRAPGADHRRLLRIASTSCGSFLCALVMVEIAIRAFLPIERVLARESLRYHEWCASDWSSAKRDYMPSIAVDAALGWAPRRGFRSDTVTVNSAGFRGPREYALEKPAGVRRIVLVGDSYTWGERTWTAETRDEDTFGARLESHLAGVEVLNLGVSGYGTDQALLRLRERGLAYSPDVVVLGIFSEDLDRNTYRFYTYAKPYFTLEEDRLSLQGTPVPNESEVRAIWDPACRPTLFSWALVEKSLDQVVKRTRFAPKWRLSEKILDACRETVLHDGARLLVLHFPVEGDLDHPDGAERHLRSWCAANHVAFVALRETFVAVPAEQRDRIYNGHLTPFGNELVAEALLARIRAEHWLD